MFLAVGEPISWSDSPHESDDETHDPRRYPHLVCGAGGDRSLAELTRHSDGLVTERDDCGVGRLLGIDHVGPCRYIDEEENMPFRFEEMVFIIQDDKLRFIQIGTYNLQKKVNLHVQKRLKISGEEETMAVWKFQRYLI